MAIIYCDFENGNDANSGLSFALRVKTMSRVNAVMATGGVDSCRVMGSPPFTDTGTTGSWTHQGQNVVTGVALNANVDDCENVWTGSAGTTASTGFSAKQSTYVANLVIVASVAANTKLGYRALGSTIDFSGYQQLSFWFKSASGAVSATAYKFVLCSDTTGDTIVNTFLVPAMGNGNQWQVCVVNLGAAMGSAIQSVALYSGSSTTVSQTIQFDNLVACKAASDPASLTHHSLISKATVDVTRTVSTTNAAFTLSGTPTYGAAAGDWILVGKEGRKILSISGATGTLDQAFSSNLSSVACEVTRQNQWYCIRSITPSTKTIVLDMDTGSNSGARGYYGVTDSSFNLLKREPILTTVQSSLNANVYAYNRSGAGGVPFILSLLSGGWNRTDMSTQVPGGDITWCSGQNSLGNFLQQSGLYQVAIRNFGLTRYNYGFLLDAGNSMHDIANIHGTGMVQHVLMLGAKASTMNNIYANNSANSGIRFQGLWITGNNLNAVCCSGNGMLVQQVLTTFWFRNVLLGYNSGPSINMTNAIGYMYNSKIDTNNSLNIYAVALYLFNTYFNDNIYLSGLPYSNNYVYQHRQNASATTHRVDSDTAISVTDTVTVYTGETVSWKTSISSNNASAQNTPINFPHVLPYGKIACVANTAQTIKVRMRRTNADILPTLVLKGNGTLGIVDTKADLTAVNTGLNTWYDVTISFTATEAGILDVEIWFLCAGTAPSSANYAYTSKLVLS